MREGKVKVNWAKITMVGQGRGMEFEDTPSTHDLELRTTVHQAEAREGRWGEFREFDRMYEGHLALSYYDKSNRAPANAPGQARRVIARQFSPMIEEKANRVFECFKKRRGSNEQSMEIEGILQSVNDGKSRKRIVNWRHTEVTSSCSHFSMSSLLGLGGKVEGRVDSSACGG